MSHILDSSTKSLPQQWRCWPARDRPFTGLVACVIIMLLAGAVLLATGDWMWGSLALMGMFLALIGFFLPTDVALSDTKIIVREPLRVRGMQWDSIQVCKDGGDALLLIQHGARRSRQMRLVSASSSGVKPLDMTMADLQPIWSSRFKASGTLEAGTEITAVSTSEPGRSSIRATAS